MITSPELLGAAITAARLVVNEVRYVGGFNFADAARANGDLGAHERALSGRLGIWLARQPVIAALEAHGVYVDLEYDQMGRGDPKRVAGLQRRIDLLVHRRGEHTSNLLVCEVKAGQSDPTDVEGDDRAKLESMTVDPFHYQVGLWLHFPRRAPGALHYATFVRGTCISRRAFRQDKDGCVRETRWGPGRKPVRDAPSKG